MIHNDTPIQKKLIRVILLTSGVVMLIFFIAYFSFEFISFRKATMRQLTTLGEIIASNSTAALAFQSREDANEILNALKAEPHVIAAALYDKDGKQFAKYPADIQSKSLPDKPYKEGYFFDNYHLQGFQPVIQGEKRVGTLFLQSDMEAMYDRFKLYGLLAFVIIGVTFLLAYLISKGLQKTLIQPILTLAETAKVISEHRDYSIRAVKSGDDELGFLTDAFNSMLSEIEAQNFEITLFNQRLEHKVKERTSELEQANTVLNQQKEFVETIINSSVDVISVFDIDLNYVVINKRSEEVYNVKREDIVGKYVLEAFPQVLNTGFHQDLKRALKGEPIYRPNYKSHVLDKYFENFFIPLHKEGVVYGVLAIGHDVTGIIEANEKLKIVNSKLVKSNRDLEQFAYVASHDLQEPLRKIQTFVGLLQRSIHDEEAVLKNIEKINSSAARMTDLIKAVLNYSRLANTIEPYDLVDLNQILENVKTDYELLITEKNAIIKNDNLPIIKGIPLQLNQLFSNLIGNSLKFSEENTLIEITTRVLSETEIFNHLYLDDDTRYIELIFKDNGIGFEQQYADKIFTIFQRLNAKHIYSGTGIGLALCKKIVENHHGYITAVSSLGAGATFYIYLPIN